MINKVSGFLVLKLMKGIVALTFVTFVFGPSSICAAELSTSDVEVALISVNSDNGGTLVQTDPRHDISGLGCTNTYWLVLQHSAVGYDAILSLLLAAQRSGSKLIVTVDDSIGGQFCNLNRVVSSR